jgi:hypothetical protein
MSDHPTTVLESTDHFGIGIKDHEALKVHDLRSESAAAIYRHYQLDTVFLADPLVIFTKARSEVHYAGAILH